MPQELHVHARQQLRDLDARECWELLSTRPVGRLVWQGPAGLTAVPVNYRAAHGQVVMHTAAYSAAARECDDSLVAFQVDLIDPLTHGGWSVLVRGRAHLDLAAANDAVEVWPAGPRPISLTVDVDEITGRRLPPAR